jgi:hypothetical protein
MITAPALLPANPGKDEWVAKLTCVLDQCPSAGAAAQAARLCEAAGLRFHPLGSRLSQFEDISNQAPFCIGDSFITLISTDDKGRTSYMTFNHSEAS